MRATARPISPEVRRKSAQNLKPHARRRRATATIRDGTEAGLLSNTDSIGPADLVSKETMAHHYRLTFTRGPPPPWKTTGFHDMESRHLNACTIAPLWVC
jgi:hypothetical protein